MNRRFRQLTERTIEGVITFSGTVTTITVLLIIIFLFKEGISLFGSSPLEEGNVLVVNQANPVNSLTAAQIKDIYDKKILVWSELGGNADSIKLFRMDDLAKKFKESELGEKFELVPQRINEIVSEKPGIIAFVGRRFLKEDFRGKIIETDKIEPGNFMSGEEWFPTAEPAAQMGVLPLIMGTLWVSFGAILIALPLALATSIFMAEIASKRVRNFLKPVVELLAGIPSVVYGFFGLVIIVPGIQKIFDLPVGETGLAGSIILGIMALPTIITISEDALRTTPRALKEASLALGATQWQTIRKVTLPFASSGITAGIVLGIGRAIGETMAVLMVTGNAAVIPHSFYEPLRTIPATIAAELGEAPYGGLHFKALFALGCILFLITFFINLGFEFVAGNNGLKISTLASRRGRK